MSNLFIPESRSLSVAWAQVFLATMHTPELSPVVVTIEDITDGRAAERDDIRNALDDQLNELGEWSCHTVANTIFPENLWNPAEQEDAERLYERHDLIWPKIQREPANRRGQYFRRLTQYLPEGMRDGEKPVNQLKHIASLDFHSAGKRLTVYGARLRTAPMWGSPAPFALVNSSTDPTQFTLPDSSCR